MNSYSQLNTPIDELASELRVDTNKRFDLKKKKAKTTQTDRGSTFCRCRYQGYNHSLKPSLGKELYPRKRILNIKKVVVTYNPQPGRFLT